MKVYAITEGDYSDYHIVGVTTDKKTAKAYIALRTNKYFQPKIEEFDTEQISPLADPNLKCFIVSVESGKYSVQESDLGFQCPDWVGGIQTYKPINGVYRASTYCFAKSAEQAIKIAQIRMARYKAAKANII